MAMQTYFDNRDRKSKAFSSSKLSDEWRNWIENVLQPLNVISEKVILENAYLIREADMPSCLLQFVAHVSAYTVLIKQWEQGDFSQEFALIEFPKEIHLYVSETYQELKSEQLDLIGKLQ